MAFPDSVRIVEVGPRDGLQNEPDPITTGHAVERAVDLEHAHRFGVRAALTFGIEARSCEGRDGRHDLGLLTGHRERHESAVRVADEIHAIGVDR